MFYKLLMIDFDGFKLQTLSNIGTKKKINPKIAANNIGNLFICGNSSPVTALILKFHK